MMENHTMYENGIKMDLNYSGKPTLAATLLLCITGLLITIAFIFLILTPLSDRVFFLIMILADVVFIGSIMIHYHSKKRKTFLSVDEFGLTIDRGSVLKRKKILFSDIETIAEQKNTVRIQDIHGVEVRIPMYLLDLTSCRELKRIIEEKCGGKILR